MPETTGSNLLDNRFLLQLEQVRFSSKHVPTARYMGDVMSRHYGASVDFADYREYQPGDDYRSIDWILLARLDRLFVRLFQAEENRRIELFLDSSTSMHFGQPTKMLFAVQLAAALGFIALRHGDQVSATAFGLKPGIRYMHTHGRSAQADLFNYLAGNLYSEGTDLNNSLRHLATMDTGNAVTIIISDLLDPNGYETGLDALLQTGRRLCLIHLLNPQEINPNQSGDFAWIDSETSDVVNISVDAHTLHLYRQILANWTQEIHHFCSRRGIDYYLVDTSTAVEDLVLKELRKGGLLG